MLTVDVSQQIRLLGQRGCSIRSIMRELKVSRNTVRRYLRDEQHGLRLKGANGNRPFKLAHAKQTELTRLYERAAGNSVVIKRYLEASPELYGLENGFRITDRAVRRFFSTCYPELVYGKPDPTFQFETSPGAQLQIDFVEARFQFGGKDCSEKVYIFEAVYAWSRKAFVRVCPDMTQTSWLMGIAECLATLGIPRQILCDNDRSLVLERVADASGEKKVRFHPAFEWLCKPLGVMPIACRPRRANTKGRVERFGRYLQENGLAHCAVIREQIPDRASLQKALEEWMSTVADKRMVQVSEDEYWSVDQLYEEKEKPLLNFPTALKSAFDISTWTAKVNAQGKVSIYGTEFQLAKDQAKKSVLISLRVNGEVLIMDFDGTVLLQAAVTQDSMRLFARDAVVRPASCTAPKPRSSRSNPLEVYSQIHF